MDWLDVVFKCQCDTTTQPFYAPVLSTRHTHAPQNPTELYPKLTPIISLRVLVLKSVSGWLALYEGRRCVVAHCSLYIVDDDIVHSVVVIDAHFACLLGDLHTPLIWSLHPM